MKEYVDLAIQWMLSSGIRILIIVVLTLIALRVTRYLAGKILSPAKKERDPEFQKRLDTLGSVTRYILVLGVF